MGRPSLLTHYMCAYVHIRMSMQVREVKILRETFGICTVLGTVLWIHSWYRWREDVTAFWGTAYFYGKVQGLGVE